jgi:hypothetical protein
MPELTRLFPLFKIKSLQTQKGAASGVMELEEEKLLFKDTGSAIYT